MSPLTLKEIQKYVKDVSGGNDFVSVPFVSDCFRKAFNPYRSNIPSLYLAPRGHGKTVSQCVLGSLLIQNDCKSVIHVAPTEHQREAALRYYGILFEKDPEYYKGCYGAIDFTTYKILSIQDSPILTSAEYLALPEKVKGLFVPTYKKLYFIRAERASTSMPRGHLLIDELDLIKDSRVFEELLSISKGCASTFITSSDYDNINGNVKGLLHKAITGQLEYLEKGIDIYDWTF